MTTRKEHIAWCQERALKYLENGDRQGAFDSMVSDLPKHPETAGHIGLQLGMANLLLGHLATDAQVRKWIEGFN